MPAEPAPRTPTPKDNRRIIDKLCDCYDDANSRYVDAFTDHSIAEEYLPQPDDCFLHASPMGHASGDKVLTFLPGPMSGC